MRQSTSPDCNACVVDSAKTAEIAWWFRADAVDAIALLDGRTIPGQGIRGASDETCGSRRRVICGCRGNFQAAQRSASPAAPYDQSKDEVYRVGGRVPFLTRVSFIGERQSLPFIVIFKYIFTFKYNIGIVTIPPWHSSSKSGYLISSILAISSSYSRKQSAVFEKHGNGSTPYRFGHLQSPDEHDSVLCMFSSRCNCLSAKWHCLVRRNRRQHKTKTLVFLAPRSPTTLRVIRDPLAEQGQRLCGVRSHFSQSVPGMLLYEAWLSIKWRDQFAPHRILQQVDYQSDCAFSTPACLSYLLQRCRNDI